MSDTDAGSLRIAIVGAGPAGSAAALSLRTRLPQAEVVLLDKATFPRDKTCGDGLGPGARRTLEELGLGEEIARFNRPISVALTGPGDVEANVRGPVIGGRDFSGYVAPRREFDALMKDAAARHGATVRQGVRFRGMHREPDGCLAVDLREEASGQHTRERFDFVIGADGAYSRTRQALGIERPAKSKTCLAIRAYCTLGHPDKLVAETLRLDFIDALLPAYGWVFPLSDGRANIGVGIPVSTLAKGGPTLRTLLTMYVEDLRRRGFEVSELDDIGAHQLPHAAAKQAMSAPGWPAVLIGDAAAMINPFSGEGIFYGMAAGIQLAEAVADAVRSSAGPKPTPDELARAVGTFERAFRARFARHYRTCYAAHQLMRLRTWARIVIRAAAKDEKILALGALMMFDEQSIGPRQFVTTALRGLR